MQANFLVAMALNGVSWGASRMWSRMLASAANRQLDSGSSCAWTMARLVWPASKAQPLLTSAALRLPLVQPGRIGSVHLLLAGSSSDSNCAAHCLWLSANRLGQKKNPVVARRVAAV